MMDQFQETFREEAYENLALLESALLELEDEPENLELVGAIFRALHTIKGSGAMFGFERIAAFTHDIETAFDLVRGGRMRVSAELIDLTLKARDRIRSLLEEEPTGTLDPETRQLVEGFRRLLPGDDQRGGPVAEAPPEHCTEPVAYRIRFAPHPGLFLSGTNPVLLLKELEELGKLTVTANTDQVGLLDEIDPELCATSWDMVLVTDRGMEAIEDVFLFVDDQSEVRIQPIETEPDGAAKRLGDILVERGDVDQNQLEALLGERKMVGEILMESGLVSRQKVESALAEQQQVKEIARDHSQRESQGSLRVPSERLDHLVNLVGEQVTVQARLAQLALSLKIPALSAISEEVARLTGELRESSLKIRMLRIGSTFSNFKRLVRDLSRELGKEIELVTSGEETELDKTVLEKLNDPLVHLIRNSMDHGIEAPERREAQGKPRCGRLLLAAAHSGDSVHITITDDGAGLDTAAILAKAQEKGLVGQNAQLSEKEIYSLIFHPGFSTAKAVTNISGRGVGMDVVKRHIEDLRGTIDIRSERGQGTTITVRIPLTLAIIESLLVRVAREHYLFPLGAVHECMFLTSETVANAHGRQVVSLRDKIVPYIRLRDRFAPAERRPSLEQLVITEIDGEKVGFVVDHVVGHHQSVIKSLGPAYRKVEGVSGATILGDGTVALILDPSKLYQAEQLQEKAA
ncbi:chemotaxis protein CheA [Geomesophilobacter sediminis]|uniref:Chemotaxis protein CheA n=1 Tax=Geomesophilobacter sediminis TaxID=2798584 RepID=A0A8J7IRK1_9BACT|nr:chemotaxis protein CheA [Geomesophilobacter sediminis]MBJ6725569.1 chemotaxis protein CheA [Geomesophilobacter sediminis]